MCGIGGFWGSFDEQLLFDMGHVLEHRGPDDAGEVFLEDQGIGLCHRRLSIIDLSQAGHQPMWDESGQYCICYNGEVYNYKELRQYLEKNGVTFKTQTDTEVVLKAYVHLQEAMLTKLNGMFAFSIWDQKRKRMLIARDGAGVKPLYYAQTPKGFLFASELKALLKEKSLSRTIDPYALELYLSFLWSPTPYTPLKEVKKLAPGTAMFIEGGEISRNWKFYDWPYKEATEDMSFEEAKEKVSDSLERAVKRQLVSDAPLGCFLSGGLDSSAITYFAKKHSTKPLPCFTIDFQGGAAQEGMTEDLPFARKVAQHLNIDLHEVRVDPSMADDVEKMIYYLDEPQADPACLNQYYISESAKQLGVKVLLSGAGGDDLFTGYRRHFALMQEKYWEGLPRMARYLLKQSSSLLPAKGGLNRRVKKAFQYADLPTDERLGTYFLWSHPDQVKELFLKKHHGELGNVLEPFHQSLGQIPSGVHPLNKMLYLEAKHFLADHNLNYGDKMSMAASVEVRVPFLDLDLMYLATKLPVDFKQHGTHGKWIFKKAMEGKLPHNLIYRPKTGFGVPLRSWLNNELKEMKRDVLSLEALLRRGLFDPHKVQDLVERDEQGKVDATYTIFSLMCIELWMQKFIEA